jgi:signal peptidase I
VQNGAQELLSGGPTRPRTVVLDLVAPDLIAEMLGRFDAVIFRAGGSSMLPAIFPGDLLHVRACAFHEIAPGDVLVTARAGGVVAHRVVTIDDRPSDPSVVTRGDNQEDPDPPVEPSAVLGRVVAVRRGGRLRHPPYTASFVDRIRALWPRLLSSGVVPRVRAAAWSLLAVANLALGVLISTWPDRQADMVTVHAWLRGWLIGGDRLYADVARFVDYPPHFVVIMSPLAFLSLPSFIGGWTLFNLVLAPLAVVTALRIALPAARLRTALVPMLVLLCWGGFRTYLQFTLPVVASGLGAIWLSRARPVASGLLLAISLTKPQVALPFLLWAVLARRWRAIAVCAAALTTLTAVYLGRVGASPFSFAGSYIEIVRVLYTGESYMHGLAQLRPLILTWVGDPRLTDLWSAAVSVLMLGGILWVAAHEMRRRSLPVVPFAPAMLAVWSILTFYTLTYGFVVLLPVAMLAFLDHPPTAVWRARVFWALQLWMMFDPATVVLWSPIAMPDSAVFESLLFHADRVLALALLTALVMIWRRYSLDSSTTTAASGKRRNASTRAPAAAASAFSSPSRNEC